MQVVYYILRES